MADKESLAYGKPNDGQSIVDPSLHPAAPPAYDAIFGQSASASVSASAIKCPTHILEDISLFREDNQSLCCRMCVSEQQQRGNCPAFKSISDIVQGRSFNAQLEQATAEARRKQAEVEAARDRKLQSTYALDQAMTKVVSCMQVLQQKVAQKSGEMKSEILTEMTKCNTLVSNVANQMQQMSISTPTDQIGIFIEMQRANQRIRDADLLMRQLSQPKDYYTGFKVGLDEGVQQFMSSINEFENLVRVQTTPSVIGTNPVQAPPSTYGTSAPVQAPSSTYVPSAPIPAPPSAYGSPAPVSAPPSAYGTPAPAQAPPSAYGMPTSVSVPPASYGAPAPHQAPPSTYGAYPQYAPPPSSYGTASPYAPPVPEMDYSYQVISNERHTLRINDDDKRLEMKGCCQLPNGQLLMADYSNRRVVLVNPGTYEAIGFCKLQKPPVSICSLGASGAVISLETFVSDTVAFVEVKNNIINYPRYVETEIGVIKDVVPFREDLYVLTDNIKVSNKDGKVQRKIKFKSDLLVSKRLAISPDGSKMYITGTFTNDSCMVTINQHGEVLGVLQDTRIKDSYDVCVDRAGNVFISGKGSNNICQVSRSGQTVIRELATAADGVESPKALCFDQSTVALLAANSGKKGHGEFHVFKLK